MDAAAQPEEHPPIDPTCTEGDDDEEGHEVPADLLELHEALEWDAAVQAAADQPGVHG